MKKKLRVGVLFGGRSGEHEVSLLSAASILKAIDRNRFEVVPIGITKQGRWLQTEAAQEWLDGKRRVKPRRVERIEPDNSDAVAANTTLSLPTKDDFSVTSVDGQWAVLDATKGRVYVEGGSTSLKGSAAADSGRKTACS